MSVLVLQFNSRPTAVRRWPRADIPLPFMYSSLVVKDGLVVQSAHSFATEAEAQAAYETADAAHQPLVWECTVNDFLRCSTAVQTEAQMFTSGRCHFLPAGGLVEGALASGARSACRLR